VFFSYEAMAPFSSFGRRHDDVSPNDLTDAAIELYAYDGDNVLLDFVDTDGTAGANAPQNVSSNCMIS